MLMAIKKFSSDGKIPRGLLLQGRPAIRNAYMEFDQSSMLDAENEKFPKLVWLKRNSSKEDDP